MSQTTPPVEPKGLLTRVSSHLVILTGLATAVGGVVATTSGSVQGVVDYFKSGDQKTSQISAIEERLSLIEKAEKERLVAAEKDKVEASRIAAVLQREIDNGQRAGLDVDDLQARLRQVELRLERLSAQIEYLREHRQ